MLATYPWRWGHWNREHIKIPNPSHCDTFSTATAPVKPSTYCGAQAEAGLVFRSLALNDLYWQMQQMGNLNQECDCSAVTGGITHRPHCTPHSHSVSSFHKDFTAGSVLWCPSANYLQKCLDFDVSLVWKAEFLYAECYKVNFFPVMRHAC